MPGHPESHPSFPEDIRKGIRKEGSPPPHTTLGELQIEDYEDPFSEEAYRATVAQTLDYCRQVYENEERRLISTPLSEDELSELQLFVEELMNNGKREGRKLLAIHVGYYEAPANQNVALRLIVGISDNALGFGVDAGREEVSGIYTDEASVLSGSGRGQTIVEQLTYDQYHGPYTDSYGNIIGKTVWFETLDLVQPRLPFISSEGPEIPN
jgi:hypothetical protein